MNISKTDGFSWRRVWEFGNIYKYSLQRQMIAYGAFSLFAALMGLMPFGATTQVGLFNMFASALGIAYYLSPVVLCKNGDTRMVMNLTPALPIEKFSFFMAYFLIILPIIVFVPSIISQLIYLHIPAVQTKPMVELIRLSYDNNYNTLLKTIQSPVLMLACFYVILVCKENRTLKGIMTVFGILVGIGLIGFILGFSKAFINNVDISNISTAYQEPIYNKMSQLMTELEPSLIGMAVVFSVGGIMLMWLIYRRLSHPKM